MKQYSGSTVGIILVLCGIFGIWGAHELTQWLEKDSAVTVCAKAIADTPSESTAEAIHRLCDSLPRADRLSAVDAAARLMGVPAPR